MHPSPMWWVDNTAPHIFQAIHRSRTGYVRLLGMSIREDMSQTFQPIRFNRVIVSQINLANQMLVTKRKQCDSEQNWMPVQVD